MEVIIHNRYVIAVKPLVGKKESGCHHGVMVADAFPDNDMMIVWAKKMDVNWETERGALEIKGTLSVHQN